ncbi:MAG: hypothetical protein LUO93_03725 [Methanomicrobiales archaeon]|nr:hypothetical protein [Methanomicrobiales archaeon]
MDIKEAVKAYQFGERAKSELLLLSQLLTLASDLKGGERVGGRRILVTAMEVVRMETEFAFRSTQLSDFQRVNERLSEAISLAESDKFLEASQPIGMAVSAATTAAQKGWQVLSDHELL